MKFLLTNDDGIFAPGLAALADAAAHFGEVLVIAPDAAHSGCGHRVTTDVPLQLREERPGWWSVSGTPADCVRVGLWRLAADVDWVLSGVNAGGNLGVDVFMSGTVAAVREGALLGRPGIAFSNYRRAGGSFDWNRAVEHAGEVLRRLLTQSVKRHEFWNVNFPDLTGLDRQPSFLDCPLAEEHLPVDFSEGSDGLRYNGSYHARPRRSGDDVDVCFSGNIAISRLTVW